MDDGGDEGVVGPFGEPLGGEGRAQAAGEAHAVAGAAILANQVNQRLLAGGVGLGRFGGLGSAHREGGEAEQHGHMEQQRTIHHELLRATPTQ